MGLDMYLFYDVYVGGDYNDYEEKKITLTRNGKSYVTSDIALNVKDVSSIRLKLAYWRKANHIHKFFIDECGKGDDDCRDLYVSTEVMRKLKTLCSQVLNDRSKASELLPTESGFFFGSTEYDEWYFEDIKDTLKQIEAVERKINKIPDGSLYYHASW